jgi:hypothetical protein
LVAELERTLANFSQLAGENGIDVLPGTAAVVADGRGFGPAVPGVGTGSVGEQEDVDDLLARMGM